MKARSQTQAQSSSSIVSEPRRFSNVPSSTRVRVNVNVRPSPAAWKFATVPLATARSVASNPATGSLNWTVKVVKGAPSTVPGVIEVLTTVGGMGSETTLRLRT